MLRKGEQIHLKQLMIWTSSSNKGNDKGYMTGVRVTLSNGKESPTFRADDNNQSMSTTMNVTNYAMFDKLAIKTDSIYCQGIKFISVLGDDLAGWNDGSAYNP